MAEWHQQLRAAQALIEAPFVALLFTVFVIAMAATFWIERHNR